MKTLILILKFLTSPIWMPIWFPFFIIKKCWRFIALLLVGSIISGCASNFAKMELSPCAGCDFMPVNVMPVANNSELPAQQKG